MGAPEAALSAKLNRSLRRPRGREIDLAIAACAIRREAELWTLNSADYTIKIFSVSACRPWPDYASSVAVIVILAFNRREIGQPAFASLASPAALSNAA